MGRIPSHWYALLMLLLVPRASSAIQLEWSSGSTALNFTSASRCTLVVQADAAEGRLPSEWRLLWATDSCDIRPLALPAPASCQQETAEVSGVEDPSTGADSLAHMPTVHFCSAGGALATIARYVFDLPAGARGRFKVVALDPEDPGGNRVLQSNEVSFNGGVSTPYPPTILRTAAVHLSTEYHLEAVGAGMATMNALSLVASDDSWRQPLDIASRDDERITATASLAANVPECIVELESQAGGVAIASLPAEPEPQLQSPESGCMQNFFERVFDDPYEIQPKDFAFVLGGWTPAGEWTFHLFYIRQNQFTLRDTTIIGRADSTAWNIGHAVSNNLEDWPARDLQGTLVIDTAAIKTRPGRFDSRHVWAPSIVKHGLTYYMFYTGVDDAGKQRLGLATSTDLATWVQGDSVYDATRAGSWVDQSTNDFRDPFVMEDPDNPGAWLLYFGAGSAERPGRMAIGVAQSAGGLTQWQTSRPIRATYQPYARVESPNVFWRQGKWWLFYTPSDTVYAVGNLDPNTNASSPSDTITANWSTPARLQSLVVDQPGIYYNWHATEYLEVSDANDIRYLAAYNDYPVSISITQMHPASPPYLFKDGCPTAAGVGEPQLGISECRLTLMGASPARSVARFRVEAPAPMRIRLTVFDVLGRKVKTLVDGQISAGERSFVWDGTAEDGSRIGSGVYFVRLAADPYGRTIRLPLIR